MAKPFHFKQFTVHQDRCAMKIGTDGVLLGAWASLQTGPESILDIGAGTGVIALMLAQRSAAKTIDAIELDEAAYQQCFENFEISSWADRLFCYHAGLDEFVAEIEEPYDLIVSNPPFYSEAVASGNHARDTARQNRSLPFEELLDGVSKLLSTDGLFATIIPFKEEEAFARSASKLGLYLNHRMWVRGNPSSEIKRSLLQFGPKRTSVAESELTIEVKRGECTLEYQELTKAFYLKM
ncbi:tRNA(1)(Val) (adenine(37)-N(6))-methyltransferase [hydrothermal vent metagenome]|uniref:tRNA(1)(Val) (Adenine(37)-N(6))-methyltransferase n=1 Tax=hydrothermal vent metagenome TaxID=652676 RepID=A0A3B0T7E4_9ZZZZ